MVVDDSTMKDFEWSYTQEPHASRRKEIIGKVQVYSLLTQRSACRTRSQWLSRCDSLVTEFDFEFDGVSTTKH